MGHPQTHKTNTTPRDTANIIQLGDKIEFTNNDEEDMTKAKVVALYRYPTFEKMFSDFESKLFGGGSVSELVEEIEQFYTPES